MPPRSNLLCYVLTYGLTKATYLPLPTLSPSDHTRIVFSKHSAQSCQNLPRTLHLSVPSHLSPFSSGDFGKSPPSQIQELPRSVAIAHDLFLLLTTDQLDLYTPLSLATYEAQGIVCIYRSIDTRQVAPSQFSQALELPPVLLGETWPASIWHDGLLGREQLNPNHNSPLQLPVYLAGLSDRLERSPRPDLPKSPQVADRSPRSHLRIPPQPRRVPTRTLSSADGAPAAKTKNEKSNLR